jgi:predicted Zn-ribbon and HTH transcriptional regulator
MPMLKYKKSEKEAEVLLRFMKSRHERKKTTTITVTGSLGSGKSYVCLRLAELWYLYFFKEAFPIKNVCFDIEQAMELFVKGNLKEGEIVIIEEAGVAINAKNFYSKVNKFFNFYMQTFRQRQIIVLFNCPLFSLIDKSTRILINANFITQSIDDDKQVCIVKPLFHQLNQQSGKTYFHYLRVKGSVNGYGFTAPIKTFEFGLPSEYLREAYEREKSKYVIKLGVRTLESIKPKEKKKLDLYPVQCNQCEYKWESRVRVPRQCPKCGTRRWNRSKKE